MEIKNAFNFCDIGKSEYFADYMGFKENVKPFLRKLYPDHTMLAEDKDFQQFANFVVKGEDDLKVKTYTNEEKMRKFYKHILTAMVGSKLGSRVDFETIRSISEPKDFKDRDPPKVAIILLPPSATSVRAIEFPTHDFLEFISPYIFARKQYCSNFFGLIIGIHCAKVIWIRDFNPKEKISSRNIYLYDFEWTFTSIKDFITLQKSGDTLDNALLRDIAELYVLFDCLKHIICI
jgi:hypothetical protein